MEQIFSEDNVQISVETLLTKGDSCGIDGIYVSQFQEYWSLNKRKILNSIYDGNYVPGIVLEFEILKKNGKKRIISKYNSTDRVLLDVIKRELSSKLDKNFSEYSYAYRENKGTYVATQQVAEYIQSGLNRVAEVDIQNFFDTINAECLCSKLKKEGIDNNLYQLSLIPYWRLSDRIQETIAEMFKPTVISVRCFKSLTLLKKISCAFYYHYICITRN